MKKILIWYLYELANTGGPKGYLYNIHEYLKKYPCDQIVFLVDLMTPLASNHSGQKSKQSFIKRVIIDIKQYCNILWRTYHYKCPNLDSLKINEFDIVHVHDIVEYYRFKNRFPDFSGKVILTNHCPCPWSYEKLKQYDSFVNLLMPYSIYKECQAYKGADYLMFPCSGAREPYEINKSIRKVFHSCESKFFYVPSAILDIKIDEQKMQRFTDLGIPKDSFVISYFGRHNEIKGYDILKKIGATLLDKYPNLYFLCAGKGEIPPLQHPRWIELGFINNTHELLYQSDLYISANRETYFDLVVLEILRSSTKALLSNTGGNKYFKSLDASETIGIDFFDITCFDELISKVESNIILKMSEPDKFSSQCLSNRKLFLNHFTIEKYIKRYLEEINNL